MPRAKLLTDEEKGSIKAYSDSGLNVSQISRQIGRSRKVIANFLKNPESYGQTRGTGRKPILSSSDKGTILKNASNSSLSCAQLAASCSKKVSPMTVWRTLKASGNIVRSVLKKFEWPKEAVLKLIELWSSYECLYNPKNALYHNKHARYDAFLNITEQLQQTCPNVEVNNVKTKITYLRAQYARELSREKSCRKSGAAALYESSAYWYHHMSFIHDFIKIEKASSNLDFSIKENTLSSEDASYEQEIEQILPSKRYRSETPTSIKWTDSIDDPLHAASLEQRPSVHAMKAKNSVDEWFISYIQDEMRSITDSNLKTELRKKILQDIFEIKEKMINMTK